MDSPRRSRRLAGFEPDVVPDTEYDYEPSPANLQTRNRFCLNYLFVTVTSFFLFTFFNVCQTKLYCA